MKRTLLLSALLALPAVAFGQDPRVRELDAFATQAVKDWRAPGLALAVVHRGKVVFARGYGVLDHTKTAPVDTQTLFAIGSTTKAMTTMALAMLVDEGKLRWDDPVTKHLPWFQLSDPYVTREVTVRDLVTHRAGLPNADYLWYRSDLSADEIVRRLRLVPSAYSLRSSFVYQNVMYAAAGQVVAAASGMSWADFLRSRIFRPLGMTRTVATLAEAERAGNVAAPHAIVNDTMRVIANAAVDPVAAAGAVWSSIGDMAKWTRFILDSGRVDGRALVKIGTFRDLVKPQTMVPEPEFYPTLELTRPRWISYGLGWFQQEYNGRKVDMHTGSIDGMVAIIGLLLDEGLGVYVLSNLNQSQLRHALMLKTFDLFTNAAPRDWSKDLLKLYGDRASAAAAAVTRAEEQRIAGTKPSLALEKYAGTFADSLYGSRVVSVENGVMKLRTSSTSTATLEHWQYDTFRARWDMPWRGTQLLTFTIGPDGQPSRLDMGGAAFRRSR